MSTPTPVEQNKKLTQKKNRLFLVLSSLFITHAIVAEILGVKIFSGEKALGFNPINMHLFGITVDFNLTSGVIIWPMVFIITDLLNEYFGKPGVKQVSILAASLIAYSFVLIFMVINLPPSDWWLEANSTDTEGHYFNMNFAFTKIFGQSQRIIIGSLIAFLIGQLTDVFIFQKLRSITGSRALWLRATGSTLVSQLIDSFVVLYIAFYGILTTQQIMAIGTANYIYKFVVSILLTPLIYGGHHVIDRYLGRSYSNTLSEEASHKSQSFF